MKNKIYSNSPVSVQNLLCSVYGWREKKKRFSTSFEHLLFDFKQSQYMPKVDIVKYQTLKLSEILLSAKCGKLYPDLDGVSHYEIKTDPFEVLGTLPVSDKTILRPILASSRQKGVKVSTSGTTGMALEFVKDAESIQAQWAIWFRHRSRFGIDFMDLSVNFTGKPVVEPASKFPFWRFNAAFNQYLISMKAIHQGSIGSIVSFLNSIHPRYWSGYPSILSEISRLALSEGLALSNASKPGVIFTGAENVLDYQRDTIMAWTGATIADQYGLSEGNCNIATCEFGNYHDDFEFGFIELGDAIQNSDGSQEGFLIGTGFYSHGMPFIRYKTGDYIVIEPDSFNCQCGRSSTVVRSINGRIDDYVLTNDGRKVMRFDYLFKNTPQVFQSQIVQRQLGYVEIHTVLLGKADIKEYERLVLRNFSTYICSGMKILFVYPDEIKKSSTGKFKAVLNLLN